MHMYTKIIRWCCIFIVLISLQSNAHNYYFIHSFTSINNYVIRYTVDLITFNFQWYLYKIINNQETKIGAVGFISSDFHENKINIKHNGITYSIPFTDYTLYNFPDICLFEFLNKIDSSLLYYP